MDVNLKGEARIAIDGGSIAIFGGPHGIDVVRKYQPMTGTEEEAIAEATDYAKQRGFEVSSEISRPRITSMRLSYHKPKRKKP